MTKLGRLAENFFRTEEENALPSDEEKEMLQKLSALRLKVDHHIALKFSRKLELNSETLGNTLPKDATKVLKFWFLEHAENPYPDLYDKEQLGQLTGLSSNQIKDWFNNVRKRHWIPMNAGNAKSAVKSKGKSKRAVKRKRSNTDSDSSSHKHCSLKSSSSDDE